VVDDRNRNFKKPVPDSRIPPQFHCFLCPLRKSLLINDRPLEVICYLFPPLLSPFVTPPLSYGSLFLSLEPRTSPESLLSSICRRLFSPQRIFSPPLCVVVLPSPERPPPLANPLMALYNPSYLRATTRGIHPVSERFLTDFFPQAPRKRSRSVLFISGGNARPVPESSKEEYLPAATSAFSYPFGSREPPVAFSSIRDWFFTSRPSLRSNREAFVCRNFYC